MSPIIAWATRLAQDLGGIGQQIASALKDVIVTILDILTPIVDVLAVGMILLGLMLICLRQEFLGTRLCIGGGVALAIVHLVIPLLLGFL